ncbi:thiamine pyrophosphate-dependent enzyme [Acuticoccus kandeliae]|uniref:thiamine pyrophosphate-dependent enzyme n=1 Tax=Acuticoccus kandeliae TaxID=2073160 RepID=UPI001FE96FCB|nr:thiamine pyrophosphate-dependent enzyme [Acuticoccus kandeliae]
MKTKTRGRSAGANGPTPMTGGEAIVAGLEAHGVDTLFGLPGAQIYGLFDALHRSPIRVVSARHEQACGYMAFGYARASGRPGVLSVVPGPGILNAGAALLTAYGANEPVLCLTGQVPSDFLGKGLGHLHEMPDQLATLSGFTKYCDRIDVPSAAPNAVAEAFRAMRSLRQGPAALEMPWEQFTATSAVVPVAPMERVPDPPVDPTRIDAAVKLIAAAKAPMIFVGSGAVEDGEAVRLLAERLGAPVVSFRSGRGIVSDRHPLGCTLVSGHRLWAETDLMIGIGTRLELPGWRWTSGPKDMKSIRIDIDAAALRRQPSTVDILARAGEGVDALLAAVDRAGVSVPDRREAIAEAKAAADAEIRSLKPHHAFLAAIRAALPDEGILTEELCQAGFASWFAYPVYQPRTLISSGYQGTLGAGFATALGAKVARPDVPVVAICGDGGFMFTVQELATAAQEGIGVVAIVFNNEAYGNVHRDQEQIFDGRVTASALKNPDFVALGKAFGVDAMRVRTPKALQGAVEKAIGTGRCTLIEVPLSLKDEVSPWSFIRR